MDSSMMLALDKVLPKKKKKDQIGPFVIITIRCTMAININGGPILINQH